MTYPSSTFAWLAPLYASLVAIGSLIIDPYLRRKGRDPDSTKLTDFYRAVPMAASTVIGELAYLLDLLRKMVDEQDRGIRSYLAYRCILTFVLFVGTVPAIYPLIKAQRWVDPGGEGKGWKCWAFMVVSNLVALVLLISVTLFVKSG